MYKFANFSNFDRYYLTACAVGVLILAACAVWAAVV